MTRFCAVGGPALVLAYGVLRWAAGDRSALGHVAFLAAVLLFAVLAVRLRQLVRDPYGTAALTATLAGAALLAGSTAAQLSSAGTLPEPVRAAGPALLTLGLAGLLALLVSVRRIPAWSPLPVLAGFVALTANPDLLPPAALLIALGLLPLHAGWYREPAAGS